MESIKYLKDGRAVEVVQALDNKSFLVAQLYEDHEGGYYPSETYLTVKEVYDQPPTEVYNTEIRRLSEELSDKRKLLQELNTEIRLAEKRRDERLKTLQKYEKLERVEEFLEGKITHYVDIDYNGPKIIPFDSTKAPEYAKQDEFKLLTLFGTPHKKLAWRLNRYNDGSGSDTTVMPCTSEGEAATVVNEYLVQRLNDTADKPQPGILKKAIEWGVTPLPEYVAACKLTEIEAYSKNVAKAQEALDKEKLKLAKAKE